MREHLQAQGVDRGGKRSLRIRSAVAVEPAGESLAAKLPYDVVVAACGETPALSIG